METSQSYRPEYQIHLPLPLAQLYVRANNAKEAQDRHNKSLSLLEATVKLVATLLISAYVADRHRGEPGSEELNRALQELSKPSQGHWIGFVRELSHYYGQPPHTAHPLSHLWSTLKERRRDTPALLALYRCIKNGPDGKPCGAQTCSPMQVLESCVEYRNEVTSHGGPREERFYIDRGGLLFDAVTELLDPGLLSPLGPPDSRLVLIRDVRVRSKNEMDIDLFLLEGTHGKPAKPLLVPRHAAADLEPGKIAVLWPGGSSPMRLDPLLTAETLESTVKVWFINGTTNSGDIKYLCYSTGETPAAIGTASELTSLLGTVLGSSVEHARPAPTAEADMARGPDPDETIAGPADLSPSVAATQLARVADRDPLNPSAGCDPSSRRPDPVRDKVSAPAYLPLSLRKLLARGLVADPGIWTSPPLCPGPWSIPEAEAAAEWLARLIQFDQRAGHTPNAILYRALALRAIEPAFYPGCRLIEVRFNLDTYVASLDLLAAPGADGPIRYLDGTRESLDALRRDGLLDIRSASNALGYVGFFFGYYRTPRPCRLRMVEDHDGLPGLRDALASRAGDGLRVEPLRECEAEAPGADPVYSCYVVHGDRLHRTRASLAPSGAISLMDEEPVTDRLDGLLREDYEGAFRIV